MNYASLVSELEELARQLDLTIRYEKGDFEGGYCILKDQKVLVINKRLLDSRKASALAVALYDFGIETMYIKPNLRAFIEDEIAKIAKANKTQ
jgi:hypothetical protein